MREIMNRLRFDLGNNEQEICPADYFDLMGGVGFGAYVEAKAKLPVS
jgi:hypothetical protein